MSSVEVMLVVCSSSSRYPVSRDQKTMNDKTRTKAVFEDFDILRMTYYQLLCDYLTCKA